MDPRNRQFAEMLVGYSMAVQGGDNVLVEAIGEDTLPLARDVVSVALERGALVQTEFRDEAMLRRILLHGTREQIAALAKFALPRMRKMQCYIGIRGTSNTRELSDVPAEKQSLFTELVQGPVHLKVRVPKTRWVVLRYPNDAMAQQAGMSLEGFADFYYRVCLLDYPRMSQAMDPLKALMERTDQVRIVGPDTDLSFSIKEIPVVKCDGHLNVPDGEVFTAPVKTSLNGQVRFNCASLFEGTVFPNITLVFKKGKVVESHTDGDNARLESILDRDRGSRGVGEFAFGLNPHITAPILDTLFDEKISGSIHMALGNSYDRAPNGNKSGIHWDLIHKQTPDMGGGEIWFDGNLIRKDGLFVIKELAGLNPDQLT